MISVLIMYPKTDDSTFDMDYYVETHMPMLADALGDACQGWGASTVSAGAWAAYGWAIVESQEAFDAAMAEHGAKIMGDVPNYTNVQPELVLGAVAR
ncbi:MAG: EthD family reductase [Actinomycetota bacterium]